MADRKLYVARITCGNSAIVVVTFDGEPPQFYRFDNAYDGLLFERMIDAQLALITHGRNKLVPMDTQV